MKGYTQVFRSFVMMKLGILKCGVEGLVCLLVVPLKRRELRFRCILHFRNGFNGGS